VLSFPPHLVREYLERFRPSHQVLDPFCGIGTTLVECGKLGVPAAGVQANPVACLASRAKTDWSPDSTELLEHAMPVAQAALDELKRQGIADNPVPVSDYDAIAPLRNLSPESQALLLSGSTRSSKNWKHNWELMR